MTITYETPVGTFSTWEQAADACARCDFGIECITIIRAEK